MDDQYTDHHDVMTDSSVRGSHEYIGPHHNLAIILHTMEANDQQAGWNHSPLTLYQIFDTSDTTRPPPPGTQLTTYSVRPYPLGQRGLGEDPLNELRYIVTLYGVATGSPGTCPGRQTISDPCHCACHHR